MSAVPGSAGPSGRASVTVGGQGKARVQDADCSSLEMWKGGLHPQYLIRESKDYCV